MSRTDLILRLCGFSLNCQLNPWQFDWLFNNVNNGGLYANELDRLGAQNSAAAFASVVAEWLHADNWSGPAAGQNRRRRRGRELSKGVGA